MATATPPSPPTPTAQSVRERQNEIARRSLAEEREAEAQRRERRKTRLEGSMSASELAAIEKMQALADQDTDRDFIAETLAAAEDDARLTLQELRVRHAAIALESRKERLLADGIEPLSPEKEVCDTSVVHVRGLPMYLPEKELLRPFKPFGTIVGWYRHQVREWRRADHARIDPAAPEWKPLTTWGLVAFASPSAVDAILATDANLVVATTGPGHKEADTNADGGKQAVDAGEDRDEEAAEQTVELTTHRCDMASHLCLDVDGKLWDAWQTICTCRLSSIPASQATEPALIEFLNNPATTDPDAARAEERRVRVESVAINHGWNANVGDIDGDALVTCADLQSVHNIHKHSRISTSAHQIRMGCLFLRMGDECADADAFSADPRCAALMRRRHKPKPRRARRGGRQEVEFATVEQYQVQLMLAETCMQSGDFYHARRHWKEVMNDGSVHADTPLYKNAEAQLALAEERYTYERTRLRNDAQKRARAQRHSRDAALAPEVADPDAIKAIADARRDGRAKHVETVHRDFMLKRKNANISSLTSGFLPQIGKPKQIKFGVGGNKKAINLAHAVGGTGVAHLLNLSDGRVLRPHKLASGWNLAHEQVEEKVKRVTDSIDDWGTLSDRCLGFYEQGADEESRLPIYSVKRHNVPQTRAEILSFAVEKTKRRPANVAPRPANQFGHKCVVPAFSQIDQIGTVVNVIENLLEDAKAQESVRDKQAAAIQAIARRRQAEKVMAKLRAEKQEEDEKTAARLAAEQREREEREAARLAAESPTTKECRLLFNEIDEDNSGALDRDEIRMLAKRLGKKLSKKALNKAMEEMDADGSGEVDFEEFRSWWKNFGSKKKGVFAGFFSLFSVSTLQQKKHVEDEEPGQDSDSATCEEHQLLANLDEKESPEPNLRTSGFAVTVEAGDEETFGPVQRNLGEVAHVGSLFESFELGQDEDGRDRGRAFRSHRAIRNVAAEHAVGSTPGTSGALAKPEGVHDENAKQQNHLGRGARGKGRGADGGPDSRSREAASESVKVFGNRPNCMPQPPKVSKRVAYKRPDWDSLRDYSGVD